MGTNESKLPEKDSQRTKDPNKTEDKPARAVSKTRSFVEPSNGSTKDKKDKSENSKQSEDPAVDEETRLSFEDWLYERLTKYFEDIQEKILKLKVSKDERNDIAVAAEEFMEFLFTETEVVDRRFRVNARDIIKVGTFHENLDIIHVDELQFCIVMDELSRENIHKIERDVKETDAYLKVYLTDNCALRWEECVEDEETDKHWLRSDRGLATTFFDRVAKAVENVRSKSRATIYRKHGRLDLLQENGVSKCGSSVELKFTWNQESIVTVVLTPCLRYDKISELIDEDSTLSKHAYKQLKSTGKLLIQPTAETDEYFQWNFGHVEKEYMKSYVSNTHKNVYKMLKFLVHGFNRNAVEEAEFFSELVLKMLVIIHDHNCKVKDRLADCVMAIIDNMRDLMKTFRDDEAPVFLKSCFYKYQNVMPTACRESRKDMMSMNLVGLEQIANHLINDVGCTALYDFNKSIKTLIPLNAFILKKDYLAKKYGKDTAEDSMEAKKVLIDAVSNKKFTVKF